MIDFQFNWRYTLPKLKHDMDTGILMFHLAMLSLDKII